GGALEVLHARDRLAGAAVGDDAGEALAAPVESGELRPRRVVDDEVGFLHGMFTFFRFAEVFLCDVSRMAQLSHFLKFPTFGAADWRSVIRRASDGCGGLRRRRLTRPTRY